MKQTNKKKKTNNIKMRRINEISVNRNETLDLQLREREFTAGTRLAYIEYKVFGVSTRRFDSMSQKPEANSSKKSQGYNGTNDESEDKFNNVYSQLHTISDLHILQLNRMFNQSIFFLFFFC